MNALNTTDIGKSSAAALDALKACTSQGAELAEDATALAREKTSLCADGAAQRVRQDPLKAILMSAAAGAAVALVASKAHGKRRALK